MDGLFHGKSHRSKWMKTGGTPMTQESTILKYIEIMETMEQKHPPVG